MFSSKDIFFAKGSANYQVNNSLRLRSSASAYLSRTSGTSSNQSVGTISFWMKGTPPNSGQIQPALWCNTANAGMVAWNLTSYGGKLFIRTDATNDVIYPMQFRDPSAWYHIVVAVDTTQATGSNRVRVYVNGVLQTASSGTAALNSTNFNSSSTVYNIGRDVANTLFFDGYIAEYIFIDGYPTVSGTTYNSTTWLALNVASLFGTNDPTTGVWVAKQYTGTYGTNGFYLPFSNPAGTGTGNDTYTKCLLHGNGLNDSAWNGSSNHALTGYGSATTSTSQSKFGMSSSLYTLGSSSQYFRTDASSDFTYAATSGSTNDFTFDFWFYPGASGTQSPVIAIADTTYSSFLIYSTQFYASSNNTGWDIGTGQSLGSPTAGQWNHYAIVRSGSTWYTFLNGVQQATWTNSSAGYNYTTNNFLQIGRAQGGSLYSTGYYSELRWSNGIARWTSNFTPPTVAYSGGSGSDSSGYVNDWRPFNINTASSGTTYDAMIDAPNIYATSATQGVGNYCVLNPLSFNSANVVDGNLAYLGANLTSTRASFAMPTSGKWYWELTPVDSSPNYVGFGLANTSTNGSNNLGSAATGLWGIYPTTTMYLQINGSAVNTTISTPALGVVFAAAYDAATGDFWIGYASSGSGAITWFNSTGGTTGNPATGANPMATIAVQTLFPIISGNGTTSNKGAINFGQRPFTYTPPSGFKSLNTSNLPTPTITNGAQYMAAVTYTGNNSTPFTVTTSSSNSGNNPLGTTFQPDLIWCKNRSSAVSHQLVDAVRTYAGYIASNDTGVEQTAGDRMTSFNANGFSVGASTAWNNSTNSYITWQWKAGGAGVSNTSGSITSTVSANTSAGFSVVTWAGSSVNASTIGHGLGVAPQLLITKSRTNLSSWVVGIGNISGFGINDYLVLQSTAAKGTSSTFYQAYGSSTFTVGVSSADEMNKTGNNYVTYCFAPVAGYSAFGSYTGNGSADGPFVFTGFRPRFVLIKCSSTGGSAGYGWFVYDTSRNTYNVTNNFLEANYSGAENYLDSGLQYTDINIDVLSNGFKIKNTYLAMNGNTYTYIYAAFAENPFKYSNAR